MSSTLKVDYDGALVFVVLVCACACCCSRIKSKGASERAREIMKTVGKIGKESGCDRADVGVCLVALSES